MDHKTAPRTDAPRHRTAHRVRLGALWCGESRGDAAHIAGCSPLPVARGRSTIGRMSPVTSASAALSAAVLVLPTTPAAAGDARYPLSQRWRIVFSDVLRGADEVVDTWDARGAPLGRARVITRTPRDQASEPIRTPSFSMRTRRGSLRGHLRVEKTYLQTTEDHQLAKFEGTGKVESGTRAFAGASGRFTRIAGKVDCFADGTCEGHLTITGSVRY